MDVFGRAYQDYLSGEKDGIIKVYSDIAEPEELPVSYFFRSWEEMPEYERLILSHAEGEVLDVGAGAGSHALELQKKGIAVDALDISPGAADVMRKRGVKEVWCGDYYDMANKGYETILFLMNGIGIAGSLSGLIKLLKHADTLLVPGGHILIESTDLMYLYEEEDGSYRVPLGERYYGELQYRLVYKNLETKPFSWLFADPDSLQHAASTCGYKTRILYAGERHNYVAVLTKDFFG